MRTRAPRRCARAGSALCRRRCASAETAASCAAAQQTEPKKTAQCTCLTSLNARQRRKRRIMSSPPPPLIMSPEAAETFAALLFAAPYHATPARRPTCRRACRHTPRRPYSMQAMPRFSVSRCFATPPPRRTPITPRRSTFAAADAARSTAPPFIDPIRFVVAFRAALPRRAPPPMLCQPRRHARDAPPIARQPRRLRYAASLRARARASRHYEGERKRRHGAGAAHAHIEARAQRDARSRDAAIAPAYERRLRRLPPTRAVWFVDVAYADVVTPPMPRRRAV